MCLAQCNRFGVGVLTAEYFVDGSDNRAVTYAGKFRWGLPKYLTMIFCVKNNNNALIE